MRRMQEELVILGNVSVLASRLRKTRENLCRDGRSQDLPDVYRLVASSPANVTERKSPNVALTCALLFIHKLNYMLCKV
jgi:hypothetical protein